MKFVSACKDKGGCVREVRGNAEMEMCLHSLTNLQSLIIVGSNTNAQ